MTDNDARSQPRIAPGVHRRKLLALGAATALGTGLGTTATAQSASTAEDDSSASNGLFLSALTGDQQPEPVETTATGGAVVSLSEDGSELEYALLVNAIEDANQAHIHLGAEGESGPAVVWLYPGPDASQPELQEGRSDGILATGTITDEHLIGDLEGESLGALVDEIRNGNAYVNVHTETHPDGEIRGQLVRAEDVAATLQNAGSNGNDVVEPTDVPSDANCAVCNMVPAEYPEWNAQLVHDDSTRAYFCTPGCLTTYYVVPEQFGAPDASITGAWVHDFETRDLIDAFQASFALETDPDRVADPMRLNPLPFVDESDATAYVKQYDDLDDGDVVSIDKFDQDTAELYRGQLLERNEPS
ncbi:CHRD domain-containing protein [Natrinema sp. HArc-T2]|uniref:CHRD domain-containing protein n=1 Tax=Natrinema sp. HArc-T2 TaxID=3242701 RepID=UPI00359E89DE